MRCSVTADEAAAIDRKCDRQALQGHVVNTLIVGALQESGIDRYDRMPLLAREPRRQRHRVLLGDGYVEVAIRKAFRILHQPRALAHRRRDRDDPWIGLSHVADPAAEHL